MTRLPDDLTGPVEVELAKAQDDVPGPVAMSGGSVYELKWDGYRVVIVRDDDAAHLWSRNGNDLTERFPELAEAATAALPAGSVVDGEVVVWDSGRLSFDVLQRRVTSSLKRIPALVREHHASFVAFDVLAVGGRDVRAQQWKQRRRELERLARWDPPLQLSPYTTDVEEARRWFVDYRPAGIEGLVVKGATSRYSPGRRGWVKVKSRETREVVVGAVIGSVSAPQALVAGLFRDGELVIVGRTVPLDDRQVRAVKGLLRPAGSDHPWPSEISGGHFGGGHDTVAITRVVPDVVAEVTADVALQGGRFRHPLRFVRVRADLTPDDVAPYD